MSASTEVGDREELFRQFGLTPDAWQGPLSESLAPPVDERARERLRALVRRELPESSARALLDLIAHFTTWSSEYAAIMKEEYLRSPSSTSAAEQAARGDIRGSEDG